MTPLEEQPAEKTDNDPKDTPPEEQKIQENESENDVQPDNQTTVEEQPAEKTENDTQRSSSRGTTC